MPERPNFVLIFPDQWRGDCLGYTGHPYVDTPFLDEMAGQGVTFTAAYSACPSCIATRACMARGQTPDATGRIGYQDRVPWRYDETMMTRLRDGGYQTINVGKTHFYPQRANLGFEINLTYDPQDHGEGLQSDYHEWLERQTNGEIRDTTQEINSNSWVAHPWVHEERLHPNTWNMQTALEQIQRRDPMRPFFRSAFTAPIHHWTRLLRTTAGSKTGRWECRRSAIGLRSSRIRRHGPTVPKGGYPITLSGTLAPPISPRSITSTIK